MRRVVLIGCGVLLGACMPSAPDSVDAGSGAHPDAAAAPIRQFLEQTYGVTFAADVLEL